eukprot:PLAT9714.1.p1 GENE.PLAT9714.1~~PLAT9714.1.p1  ORF type:complete len:244 (+),score=32.17 PLAT9714.1:835-1566(+)
MTRYCKGTYCDDRGTLLGAEFICKSIRLDGLNIKVCILHTAGSERMQAPTARMYLRQALGIMYVYDVTSSYSLDEVRRLWYPLAEECSGAFTQSMLVGTRIDDVKRRQVSSSCGRQFADSIGIPFFETSAKDNTNVEEAFTAMIRLMLKQKKMQQKIEQLSLIAAEERSVFGRMLDFFSFSSSAAAKVDATLNDGAGGGGSGSAGGDEEAEEPAEPVHDAKVDETEPSDDATAFADVEEADKV